jgi:uncharacterized protein (TIGR03435 family)
MRSNLDFELDLKVSRRSAGRNVDTNVDAARLEARATMEKFAETLSGHLDRPVKDMTQLDGEYSFHLAWTPDRGISEEPSEFSIFIAIQEQLGLKLEAGNEAIELLMIDKAEKTPTSN